MYFKVIREFTYAELTELHKIVKEELHKINEALRPSLNKKLSECTDQETELLHKRFQLNGTREEIRKCILSFAETVKLPEELV